MLFSVVEPGSLSVNPNPTRTNRDSVCKAFNKSPSAAGTFAGGKVTAGLAREEAVYSRPLILKASLLGDLRQITALPGKSEGPVAGKKKPAFHRGIVPLRASLPSPFSRPSLGKGGTGSGGGRAGPQHGGHLALRAGCSGGRGRPAPGCPVARASHHGTLGSCCHRRRQ